MHWRDARNAWLTFTRFYERRSLIPQAGRIAQQKMPSGMVIDLLSSDEDNATSKAPIAKETAIPKPDISNDFVFLQDDFDSITHLDDEWIVAPAKRRKLDTSIRDGLSSMLSSQPRSNYNSMPGKSTARSMLRGNDAGDVIDDDDDDDDPIIFTSSAHAPSALPRSPSMRGFASLVESDGSSESLPEDVLNVDPRHSNIANLTGRTAALLTSLYEPVRRPRPTAHRIRSGEKSDARDRLSPQANASGVFSSEDEAPSLQAGPPKSRKAKLTEEERQTQLREKEKAKAARARQRELLKEDKAKAKEEDSERKRLSREEKAKEKQKAAARVAANKANMDKKYSTPQMIVDLPASIDGSKVDFVTREFLKNLSVDATLYQSIVPNVVKWRRKMKATWNTDVGEWEPLERMTIENEKHILCLMSAQHFVPLAMASNGDEDIEMHVATLKSAYVDSIPIYLIEGLDTLLKKCKTAENRAYQAQVLAQCRPEGQAPKQRKRPEVENVDEDKIEDALLRLQVMHSCLVYHTKDEDDSATWIANFTQHISTIPYRYFDLKPNVSVIWY